MENGPAVITVSLILASLGLKLTDFVKYVVALLRHAGDETERNDALNGIVTLLVTAVVGYLTVESMLKPSAWGDEITIGQEKLNNLTFGSTVVFGLVFTALASTLYDFKKAVDNGDDAEKPRLIG